MKMKQIISIITFTVIISVASAQQTQVQTINFTTGTTPVVNDLSEIPDSKEITDALMEFTYDHRFLTDTTDTTSYQSELWILQTSRDMAKFSSLMRMQIDSMLQAATIEEILAAPDRFGGGNPFAIFKNYPQGKFTTIDKISTDWMKIEEEIEQPKWELKNETKEILGNICRRAETTFKGRRWIAWYTDEITATTGPWKLDGLPGLVCEASDSEGHYSYTLVGISTSSKRKITIPDAKFNNTTIDKYYKTKRSFIENPLAGLISSGVNVTFIDQTTGKPKNEADFIQSMKYDFIER